MRHICLLQKPSCREPKLVGVLFFIIFCLLVLGVGTHVEPVFAQQYIFEEGGNNSYSKSQALSDPQNLKYIYAVVTSGGDVIDFYSLKVTRFTPHVTIELLIPKKDTHA